MQGKGHVPLPQISANKVYVWERLIGIKLIGMSWTYFAKSMSLFTSLKFISTSKCQIIVLSSSICQIENADNAKNGLHNNINSTHHQLFPTNGKVALVADVDGDGVKELIIASTDRVVRVFKWVKEEIQKGVCVIWNC